MVLKKRRDSRVIISSMLIIWLGLGFLQPVHPVVAEGEPSAETLFTEDVRSGRYSRYIEGTENDHYTGAPILIDDVTELDSDQLETYEGDSVIFIDQDQTGTLTVEVPETAYYIIGFEYKIKGENVLPTQLSLTVNGDIPFYEMQNLIFEHGWTNPEDTPLDKYGNEIIPQPIKYDEWQTKFLIDSSYRTSLPLMVKLEEGQNDLALTISEGNLLIKSVEIRGQLDVPTYEPNEVAGNAFIEVEAANQLHLRNNSAIRANSSYNVNLIPYSSDKRVLNHIDPDSFKTPGDMIHYQVEVEEAGYYHLGMHYQQDAKADFPVFMNIRINGALQHDYLKDYPFFYQNNYEHVTLVDETNEKLTVYLEKGVNDVSFQISIAPIKSVLEEIEQLTSEIQDLSFFG